MTDNNKNRMNTFMQRNKNLLIALAAIVVVIILAIMLPKMTKSQEETPVVDESAVSDTTETSGTKSASMTSGEAAYKTAIAKNEGNLITVMNGCVAEPKTKTIALGENALLVNASDVPHTFVVGDTSYTLGERHYKTLRFSAKGDMAISCDDQKNIATITVE